MSFIDDCRLTFFPQLNIMQCIVNYNLQFQITSVCTEIFNVDKIGRASLLGYFF